MILPKTVVLCGQAAIASTTDEVGTMWRYLRGRLSLFMFRGAGSCYMYEVPWCSPISTTFVSRYSRMFSSLQETLDSEYPEAR